VGVVELVDLQDLKVIWLYGDLRETLVLPQILDHLIFH